VRLIGTEEETRLALMGKIPCIPCEEWTDPNCVKLLQAQGWIELQDKGILRRFVCRRRFELDDGWFFPENWSFLMTDEMLDHDWPLIWLDKNWDECQLL
jgi:hypothetical protein